MNSLGLLVLDFELIKLKFRSAWLPDQQICAVLNTEGNKLSIISALVTGIVLLIIMLVGLVRMGCHGSGAFRLGQLLWKQVRLSPL